MRCKQSDENDEGINYADLANEFRDQIDFIHQLKDNIYRDTVYTKFSLILVGC